MLSIARHIDEHDIIQEIRLERSQHKGSFLIVEGKTDVSRFSNFISQDSCSLVNAYGRRNAIRAIELLNSQKVGDVAAVVDADFDRITGKLKEHPNLIYSEYHDFDLDWATPSVVSRYLDEVADASKLANHASIADIINKILTGLKPISILRLLNVKRTVRYKLSNIRTGDCFVNFSVDFDKYIDLIRLIEPISEIEKSKIESLIAVESKNNIDLRQLTNGHDFHCAIGACLKKELGRRRDAQTWGNEIEMHFRFLFGDAEFIGSSVFTALRNWENSNSPYKILNERLN